MEKPGWKQRRAFVSYIEDVEVNLPTDASGAVAPAANLAGMERAVWKGQ